MARSEADPPIGNRIHVTGNVASGKSTLARRLAEALDAPLVELDALNWLPGWVGLNQTDPDEFARRIRGAIRGERWVVAGSYGAFSRRIIWPRLDTVIWLDLPMPVLAWRALRRSWKRWRTGELLWGTNRERFWPQLMIWRKEDSLLGWLITQHARKRGDMVERLGDPRWRHIRFVRLRSAREVEEFIHVKRPATRSRRPGESIGGSRILGQLVPSPVPSPVSRSWDDEYRRGRYQVEPPVPFVGRIVAILRDQPEIMRGRGLYVGCGNGRNYVALVNAGLNLIGLDVSKEAIAQLQTGHPHLAPDLVRADFRDFHSELPFDYIVAIQVFQHGFADAVRSMFARAAKLLKRGGLLFVRVNSASTDVYHAHRVVERGDRGGFTVRYDEGPKRGLAIHFMSLRELRESLDPWFTPLVPMREQVTSRESPKRGSWAQWEGVWVRR